MPSRATKRRTRQPLADATASPEQTQLYPSLIEIFNGLQHVTSSEYALTQLKKLHKNSVSLPVKPVELSHSMAHGSNILSFSTLYRRII